MVRTELDTYVGLQVLAPPANTTQDRTGSIKEL
jgi:hypothetical protein